MTDDPATGPAATHGARLGIYLTPQMLQRARAAYLADWYNGGNSDRFADWIVAAVDAHAGRTPAQRASASADTSDPEDNKRGVTRTFDVADPDAIKRMQKAIADDRGAGRWLSDSAWCREALDRAITRARSANGGSLPSTPKRLPNRLGEKHRRKPDDPITRQAHT